MRHTDTASAPEPSHQVLEQAAAWFALFDSDEVTASDRMQWESWLAASAEHRLAWSYVERISHRFAPIKNSPERSAALDAYQQVTKTGPRRRESLLGIAALVGTGLLGWVTWRHTPLPDMALAWMADYHTGTGEVREVVLADGTHVWLNAVSAFNADYGQDLRRLYLVRGEIQIQTAADAHGRPFVVDTPQGRLRALGTHFTVRLDGGETLVVVHDGAVEVRAGTTAVIRTGEQIRFTEASLAETEAADPARESWTRGLLVARNIPLSDVIGELQRHHHGHLSLSPEVADLRVFGGYPVNNPDQALTMLESVMPIRVRRRTSWWISIQPRRETDTSR